MLQRRLGRPGRGGMPRRKGGGRPKCRLRLCPALINRSRRSPRAIVCPPSPIRAAPTQRRNHTAGVHDAARVPEARRADRAPGGGPRRWGGAARVPATWVGRVELPRPPPPPPARSPRAAVGSPLAAAAGDGDSRVEGQPTLAAGDGTTPEFEFAQVRRGACEETDGAAAALSVSPSHCARFAAVLCAMPHAPCTTNALTRRT